jgi:hypothetical protein
MKSSIDSSAGSAALLTRIVSERDERASSAREGASHEDRDEELWAHLVAELLVQRLPPPQPRKLELEASVPTRNTASVAPAGSGELAAPHSSASQAGAADQGTDVGAPGGSDGIALPSELSAEVSDERFGRLQLHVARGGAGLDIVINVADSRVKALIEAEHAVLIKTLKDAGLRVASVQIGNPTRPGTGLALDRGGAERPRAGAALSKPSARRRAYPSSRDEEDDQSSEGVDFTA